MRLSRGITVVVALGAMFVTGLPVAEAASGGSTARPSASQASAHCVTGAGTFLSHRTHAGKAYGFVPPLVSGRPCASTPSSTSSGTGATTSDGDVNDSGEAVRAGEGPYGGSPPLVNHGGPIMSTVSVGDQVTITPIWWAPAGYSFDPTYKSVITSYLSDVAADSGKTSNVFASMYQYSGNNGDFNYKVALGSAVNTSDTLPSGQCAPNTSYVVYPDGHAYTSCITQSQMQTELQSIITTNGLPADFAHIYALFLPEGVETCSAADGASGQQCQVNSNPATSAYCAFHTAFGSSLNALRIWANMPYPVYGVAGQATCTQEYLDGVNDIQTPNGNAPADVEISPLSHELSEAMTDPFPAVGYQGWVDSSGNENGDDCAYIYGNTSGPNGGLYNQTINGHHYLTQEEFSNADYVQNVSGCIQGINPVTPAVTAVTPTSGGSAGGSTVTITGTGFPGATAVKFGGVNATSYAIKNAKQITAVAPAGAGTVDVTVSTAAGTSTTSSADQFSYLTTPTVTGVSPSAGPTSAGGTVVITGTGFATGASVSFGGTAATSVTVNSATSITAGLPAHAAGTVDVTVTTGGGTSATSSADHYTFTAAPTVSAVSPSAGPTTAGSTVAVTGTGFASGASVLFGTTAATSVVVNSATSITAGIPAHSAGTVDVTVSTAGGGSATSSADHYTFTSAPTVTSLSPVAGPTGGGTSVTITGANLTGATSVHFGTVAGAITASTATTVTATAPAHAAGGVDVTVTTVGGTSATSASDTFTYDPAPTVSAVTPADGSTSGGTNVTITGTGFVSGSTVAFGTSSASPVTVVDGSHITVTSPAHAAGAVHVVVTTPGGASTSTVSDQFTYVAPPTVSALSSTSGPTAGGGTLTISGSGFTGANAVYFGSTSVPFTYFNDARIDVTIPAHAAATLDVTVVNDGGTSATGSADQYSFLDVPTVSGVLPNVGPTAGGTTVTITGTGFVSGATVYFGATPATGLTFVNAARVTVVAPAEAAATVDVTVATAGGTSSTGSADHYRYVAPPTVTGVSPAAGPTAGGGAVTITGTNLTGATAVSFGSVGATFTPVSDTEVDADVPAHAAGTLDVTVTTDGGTSATGNADKYTYVAAPTVTSVSPAAGPTGGGTSVTITGSNLSSATAVHFGAVTGAITANTATSVTATAPAHTAGGVDVTVTTVGGTSVTGAGDTFTYDAAPTVSAVTPADGPTAGGTVLSITGANFLSGATVAFGTTSGQSVTVVDSSHITVTSPAHGAGAVHVVVTTPGGASTSTGSDQFTYVAAPTVTGVSPAAGPAAGGGTVTITGTNLTGATAVSFGDVGATFTPVSDTQVTADIPAGAAGAVDVTVTTDGGTSATGSADTYTYVAAPTVSSVGPTLGSTAGGSTVTVIGTGFATGATVAFGSTAGTNVTVVSSSKITVTAPAQGAGTVDVIVTTAGGPSSTSSADHYRYVAPPTVTALSSSAGPAAGGGAVTITGTNLTGATAVSFGAVGATFTPVSDTKVDADVPAHTAGTVDVTVTTDGGTSTTSSADSYTFVAAPAVTSVSPNAGPTAGGTSVTITGSNLSSATEVQFGTVAATVTANSATQITVTAPAHAAGDVDVTVTTSGGPSATSAADTFSYDPAPTVSSVSPADGPTAGGTDLTITGTGFTAGSTVTVDGLSTTPTSISPTQITATAPAHAAGTVDVVATTPGGPSASTASDQFTYVARPTVTGVSPDGGPTGGGGTLTITGTNLTGATAVSFGNVGATFTPVSDTQVTADIPAGAAGTADVTVQTDGGTSATGISDHYTWMTAPTVTGISPAAGPIAGGQTVTITGSDFVPGATVQFGGVAGTAVTVASSSQLTATTPAHGAGKVAVTVTTPGGVDTPIGADVYSYDARPAVTAVSPRNGPLAGGQTITITGNGFIAGSVVRVGGVLASKVAWVSATKLTAHTPAHAAGLTNITVTTPGGTSALVTADRYTYLKRPTVTSVSPKSGTHNGGTTVTIRGSGFVRGASVKFGSTLGLSVKVVSATKITVRTPKHAKGSVSLTVHTPGGTSATTKATHYTFT